MRHGKALRKLGRNPSHRRALLRNLATSLIIHGRIETTLPKAKELKSVADNLITLGKRGTLHARRQAMAFLFAINRQAEGNALKLTAVHNLFDELAPRFTDRDGGYTRVIRTRKRPGDKAQMAVIEFVEAQTAKQEKKKRRVIKKADAPADAPQATEATAEA